MLPVATTVTISGGVDHDPHPRLAVDARPLDLGYVGLLCIGEPSRRVDDHAAHRDRDVDEAEEVEGDPSDGRRTHREDLGIPPDDQRVGVMAGVAPTPHRRAAHDHEAGDLVDGVVHPRGLEGRAMPGFVPAGVRRRAVQHAVDGEQRNPHEVAGDERPSAEAAEHGEQARTTATCRGPPGRSNDASTPSSAAAGSAPCTTSPRRVRALRRRPPQVRAGRSRAACVSVVATFVIVIIEDRSTR